MFSQVGIQTATPSATLDIVSSGNTNTTKALEINNSSATEMVTVLDNGNVGIGTNAPSQKLHVRSTSGTAVIALDTPTGSNAQYRFLENGASVWKMELVGGSLPRFSIYNYAISAHALTIKTSTNDVAMGDAIFNSKLGINGYLRLGSADATADALSSASDRAGMIRYSAANGLQYHDTNDWLTLDNTKDAFENDNTNTMVKLSTTSNGSSARSVNTDFVIKDDGKVGIGTSNPTTTLDIAATTDPVITLNDKTYSDINFKSRIEAKDASGSLVWRIGDTSTANNNLRIDALSTGSDITMSSARDLYITAGTSGRVRVNENGGVAIGSYSTPTSKLQVVGLPTYANDAAAGTGGLTQGAFYQTATGELRVKL